MKTWMTGLVSAVFLLSMFAVVQAREIRITNNEGGSIIRAERHWKMVAARGDRVVIDGLCQSACTVILGIVPRNHLCYTDRAVLGFHMAFKRPPGYQRPFGMRGFDRSNRIPDPILTKRLTRWYPAPVRRWIRRHGGLTGLDFKYMRANEMTFLKHCS